MPFGCWEDTEEALDVPFGICSLPVGKNSDGIIEKNSLFFIVLVFHGSRELVMSTKYLFVDSEEIQQVVIWEENL